MSNFTPSPLVVHCPQDVGGLIREQRQLQKVRIDDTAALLGVSVDLMSRLENAKGSVRLDKVLTVLDGLGLAMVIGPRSHPLMRDLVKGIENTAESLPQHQDSKSAEGNRHGA